MKTQIISCFFSFLFIICGPKNIFAQSSDNFNQNKKTYDEIVKILKTNSIPTDTTNFKLGGYKKILESFLDLSEINKKSDNKGLNDNFSHNAMYRLLYISLATLHSFTRNFPSDLIKIIPYTKSKTLDKNWRKDTDAYEIAIIENSILLLIKNKKKYYEVLLLNFNPQNRKLNFLLVMDTSKEAKEYFHRFYKTNN